MASDHSHCYTSRVVPKPFLMYRGREHVNASVAPDQLTVADAQYPLITHIRVTHISTRLRRIPVGFYAAVTSEYGTQRTSNEPAAVGNDVVEWKNDILLPSEFSSNISLAVFASFELGPTLGDGEVIRELHLTVGELLGLSSKSETVRFSTQDDGSVEIKIGTITGLSQSATVLDAPLASEETCRIEELTCMGCRALVRYREFREQRILDESIRHLEMARDLCPADHSSRATVLFSLANARMMDCRRNEISPDLDTPIELYRSALSLRPRDHPTYPFTQLSLGVGLKARFQRQANEADKLEGDALLSQVLDVSQSDSYVYQAAIFALRCAANTELLPRKETSHAVEHSDGDVEKPVQEDGVDRLDDTLQWIFYPDSSRPALLDPLGILFCVRLDLVRQLLDGERAISVLEVVVKYTSDDHPHKPVWLVDLAHSLWSRYERFRDARDLDKSMSLEEEAVRLTPDGHPVKPIRLGNLAVSLMGRYERFGNIMDLEKSILLKENALRLVPDGHPERLTMLSNLARSLSIRYQRFGNIADLEKSISLKEDTFRLALDGHPEKPTMLGNLARSLSSRYQRFGNIVDLEKSISLMEDALRCTPDGHPDKPTALSGLAYLLSNRYQRFGDIADLEKSMSLYEDAAQLAPDGHPDKPRRLNNLASSLSSRYQRFGNIVDLEKSISLMEDALGLTPDDHTDRPTRLGNLALSLTSRYERFGDIADLKKSISLRENAVRLTPDGHPDKPTRLGNLAVSLSCCYEHFGDVVDLEKSISLKQDALRLMPNGHPDKPTMLSNLACSLSSRYERFGDILDMEKSISLEEDSVQLMPDGHPDKPLRMSNLARSLSSRYERFGDILDLGRCISLEEDAVQLTPDGHPDKPIRLSNLARSLSSRYERFGDILDLERWIALEEAAVQLTPDGHPAKPSRLGSLAYSFSTRYGRFSDVVDLEKSILLDENAVRLTPDGHPKKPVWLHNTAHSLLRSFHRFGKLSTSQADLRRAVSYSSLAAHSHTGQPSVRFRSSQLWIHCLRHLPRDVQSLFGAYTVVVDLLPQLAWIGLSFQDRYHQLLQAAGSVSDAAAVALDLQKSELAIEWLEQGRSIMWSQLSQLRTPVDDLRSTYPALAAEFELVSRGLEHAVVHNAGAIHMMDALLETRLSQHHELALRRETLLKEIRALPGFETFLLPKKISQLSGLAHSGHVVFLNASKRRCDALVIMSDSKQVTHIPLSHTSYDEVASMLAKLNTLLRSSGRVILREGIGRPASLRLEPNNVFKFILSNLWNKVVSPVLDALCLLTPPTQLTRIFWCPTGPFTFLPIHAAGIYDATNQGPKISDFVISSYIPTMNALPNLAQKDSVITPSKVRLLAVPQPTTDGECHLYGVREEMKFMIELTSSSPFMDFQDADGTVEDVLSKMKESDWVHFCCHGTQDRTNPLDSGLLLADCTRLRLSDVVQLSRARRGLAFLSACQTAMGDEKLSDEAIHLAAGMLLAGYGGVIATMWSIMDSDAPRVTKDVYTSLFREGRVPDSTRAAEALHCAVQKLRDSGAPFLSWVPFVHYGL